MSSRDWQEKKKKHTREKVLQAARKVFCSHPYATATTRMIAKEAKVDHPLIHYHFGSKEELFQVMALEMLQDFMQALSGWFAGMEKMNSVSGFELFIERILDYTISNPEVMQLFLINMAQERVSVEIPGFDYLQAFADQAQKLMKGLFPNLGSYEEFDKFIISFANIVISFVGGKVTQSKVIGLDPESLQYRQWVKETLLVIYSPLVEKIAREDHKLKKSKTD